MRLQEILDQQAAIRNELSKLDEDPDTTEEDHGDLRDSLVARYKELDERAAPIITRMEEIKAIKARAEDERGIERSTPDLVVRASKRDPFAGLIDGGRADLDAVRMLTSKDAITRSQNAIEEHNRRGIIDHDRAEAATRRVQGNPGIARHLLMTGSEEYREAFEAYLRNPEQEMHRAAMSLTLANGGYMLPYVLDPSVVLTNAGSMNPFRRVSNIKQTTSNTWNGVNSAGVNAAWLAEGAAAADASPTFGNIQITPVKGSAWVFGSFEVLQDTDFSAELPTLLADAKDRLEESAFAVGTGTAQPLGVVAALGTGNRVAAVMGTGGAFSGTGGTGAPQLDVYNVQAKLAPRFRMSPNTAWLANITNINKIRAIDQYGGSSFLANLGQGQPDQLLGDPLYESTSVTTTSATGTGTGSAVLVYGDFSQFYIVDRVGTSLIYNPLVTGTGASANVPTGQAGWFYYWRTSSGVSTTAAFSWLANGS